jgi:hypothetical protein
MDLMLDSGAFTAWKKGKPVDIGAYADYILEHQDPIESYVNLDVISGAFGRTAAAAEVEEAAQMGYKNLLYLESRGLKAIPVIHIREREYWLEAVLDRGYDYIGFSATSLASRTAGVAWYNAMWSRVINEDGLPTVKVHGFGETSPEILYRYPWYSIDSATWGHCSRYGLIVTPVWSAQGLRYDLPPQYFYAANKENHRARGDEKDLRIIDSAVRERLEEYLQSIGTSIEEVSKVPGGHLGRSYAAAKFFVDLEADLRSKSPVSFNAAKMFFSARSENPVIHIPEPKLYLADSLMFAARQLVRAKADRWLLSYAFLRDFKQERLLSYASLGYLPRRDDDVSE